MEFARPLVGFLTSYPKQTWVCSTRQWRLAAKMKAITHIGAYAVVRCGAFVVLVRKTRGPYKGSWDLPGGRIEFGETPVAALQRELREEIGVSCASAVLEGAHAVTVSFTNEEGDEISMHHLALLYSTTIPHEMSGLGGEGRSEDTGEVRRFGLDELIQADLSPFADYALRKDPRPKL